MSWNEILTADSGESKFGVRKQAKKKIIYYVPARVSFGISSQRYDYATPIFFSP